MSQRTRKHSSPRGNSWPGAVRSVSVPKASRITPPDSNRSRPVLLVFHWQRSPLVKSVNSKLSRLVFTTLPKHGSEVQRYFISVNRSRYNGWNLRLMELRHVLPPASSQPGLNKHYGR